MTGLAASIVDHVARAAARASRERPILMQPDMARAALVDLKLNTRRLKGLDTVNEQPGAWTLDRWQDGYPDGRRRAVFYVDRDQPIGLLCPYGQAGDRLWVKENYYLARSLDSLAPSEVQPPDTSHHAVHYAADLSGKPDWAGRTRVSIHMPRWCSRMLLEITDVKVERLQAISERDAQAEGTGIDWERVWANGHFEGANYPCAACSGKPNGIASLCHPLGRGAPWRCVYANTWDSINPQAPWSLSPWVWSIHFRRIHPHAPRKES